MAEQDVEWSCGHTTEVQVYGSRHERERYLGWAGSIGLCTDCYREKKRAERERVGAENRALAPDSMPEISSGTEKQNAYATDIRARLWAEYERYVTFGRKRSAGSVDVREVVADENAERVYGCRADFVREVFGIYDHRYWIDVVGRRGTYEILEYDRERTTEWLQRRREQES